MVAIRTKGLTKRYGSGEGAVLALDGLDLEVEKGEVFGFLGPNGAGKSTTINMLLNFIDPTDGSAEVLGFDVQSESKEVRRRIGVLPEGYDVFERLTAREHIKWVNDAKGTNADPDEILQTVGIPEAADRKAGGFSKGMQQRLALGMALVGDPDLLILDEPSSGLDPTGMQEMRELIREQAEQGTTVFFSSHILSEVEAVCDRVAILNQGQLVVLDTLENLRDSDIGVARIELEVESIPESLDLTSLKGVQTVTTDDDELTVVCEDSTVKADVVTYVAQHTDITDIVSEDTSLEELFNRYTGDAAESSRINESTDDKRAEAPEVPA